MSYNDFTQAAKNSRTQKAISEPFQVKLAGRKDIILICIVKPLHGDAYAVYKTAPGLKVVNYTVSTRDVDNIKSWESF